MKPCPGCGVDQPDMAVRCADCGSVLAPPTGALPIDPLLELRAKLETREHELTAATAALTDFKRESEKTAATLRQRADALTAENEKLRATPVPPPPTRPAPATTTAEASSGVWGSAALIGLLKTWPRVATAATAVMALGTAYGGFDLGKNAIQGTPAPRTIAVADTTGVSEAAIKERDDLREQVKAAGTARDTLSEQLATVTKERDALTGQTAAAVKERTDLATRLSSVENQLSAASKDVAAANAARDQALARERTALARPTVAAPAPVARPQVSAGYLDIIVPRGSNNSDVTVQRGRSLLLPGGAWPSGECTLLAGDPEARFQGATFESVGNKRRTTVLNNATCNAATIVVKKSQDWDEGDVVRLFWQLRER